MKRAYMYNVIVEGKSIAVLDTADEALRYSMGYVYMSHKNFNEYRSKLESGEPVNYSYGFSSVQIVPVAKRRQEQGKQ